MIVKPFVSWNVDKTEFFSMITLFFRRFCGFTDSVQAM